jgi:hypothetical protein
VVVLESVFLLQGLEEVGRGGVMACPQEAKVVVVGADDSETSFSFDALVENEEGSS